VELIDGTANNDKAALSKYFYMHHNLTDISMISQCFKSCFRETTKLISLGECKDSY